MDFLMIAGDYFKFLFLEGLDRKNIMIEEGHCHWKVPGCIGHQVGHQHSNINKENTWIQESNLVRKEWKHRIVCIPMMSLEAQPARLMAGFPNFKGCKNQTWKTHYFMKVSSNQIYDAGSTDYSSLAGYTKIPQPSFTSHMSTYLLCCRRRV